MYKCLNGVYYCSGNRLHCFLKHGKILFEELKNVYVFIYKSKDWGYVSIVTYNSCKTSNCVTRILL